MATKKAASAKKSKPTAAKKQTTTKVTTVKAAATTTKSSAKTVASSKGQLMTTALVAEFIGTFVLAAVALSIQGNAFFMGFALVAIVLMIGALSGAHVNPITTVGAWVTRKISGKRALGYVVAQALGAMLALVVMTSYANLAQVDEQAMMMGGQQALFTVTPVTGETESVWYIFFAEMIGAVLFAFAVSAALRMKKDRAAQAMTVGLGFFVALAIAGGAAVFAQAHAIVNPALALSLQAVEFPVHDIFSIVVYIVAPILGGALGFFLYDLLRGPETSVEEAIE